VKVENWMYLQKQFLAYYVGSYFPLYSLKKTVYIVIKEKRKKTKTANRQTRPPRTPQHYRHGSPTN
jgi:hypothetical protein